MTTSSPTFARGCAQIEDGSTPDQGMANLAPLERSSGARGLAISLLSQGKSAAAIWEALVANGVDRTAAEVLIREIAQELIQIRRQREAEREHADSGFCKACFAGSSWQSPGNISTVNGTGSKFYGGAERCQECGSEIRVLWAVFCHLPVFPWGTYRYREVGTEGLFGRRTRFIARETRMRWSMVLTHWLVGLGGILGLVLLAAAGGHHPR